MTDGLAILNQFFGSATAFELSLFLISILTGLLGAILGIGGGIFIVPVLTLMFGVHIRYAIGASIVSVIATSCSAASVFLRKGMTNIRLALVLEIATTLGALIGVALSSYVSPRFLFILFSLVLLYSGLLVLKNRVQDIGLTKNDKWAEKLSLGSSYFDLQLGQEVKYGVANFPKAFVFMGFAGVISALLGIGSGVLKVPAMDAIMKLPIKISSATSNFMIGVTAAAGASAYFLKGDVIPAIAAPVALGVFVGSKIGARIMTRLPSSGIRKLFVIVLLLAAVQMLLKAFK